MKIRTDFVTNSSSSSFIFKEFDIKKLKDIAKKRMTEPCNTWEEYYIEGLMQEVQFLSKQICEFKDLELSELREVYDWYCSDMLCHIFGKKVRNADWREIAQRDMIEEQKRRWMAYILLHLYGCYHSYCDVNRGEERIEIISKEHLENIVEYYMAECWECEMYEYIMENLEVLRKELLQFVGMHYGEVLACAFAAKYIYFHSEETHYIMMEMLEEAGMCEFACCHMG